MAADILAFDVDVVPVGRDQKQHIEIARDIAGYINTTYGESVLKLPEALIKETSMLVPGLDGAKMSKSKNNIIPVFEDAKKVQKLVNKIITDCSEIEEPKDPNNCTIFSIYKCFANLDEAEILKQKYLAGGMGWGEAKKILGEKLNNYFEKPRVKYNELINDKSYLKEIMKKGSMLAREEASKTLSRVKSVVGII
jgi:tryptophanyl-tRNA synthetase